MAPTDTDKRAMLRGIAHWIWFRRQLRDGAVPAVLRARMRCRDFDKENCADLDKILCRLRQPSCGQNAVKRGRFVKTTPLTADRSGYMLKTMKPNRTRADDSGRHEVMTFDEVCGHLRLCRPTLTELIRSGRLPATRLGKSRAWRILRKDVDALFKGRLARRNV